MTIQIRILFPFIIYSLYHADLGDFTTVLQIISIFWDCIIQFNARMTLFFSVDNLPLLQFKLYAFSSVMGSLGFIVLTSLWSCLRPRSPKIHDLNRMLTQSTSTQTSVWVQRSQLCCEREQTWTILVKLTYKAILKVSFKGQFKASMCWSSVLF